MHPSHILKLQNSNTRHQVSKPTFNKPTAVEYFLPLSPPIVLLPCLPARILLHSARPNTRWFALLLRSIDSRLASSGKLIPKILLFLGRPLGRLTKRLPKVFALGFASACSAGVPGGLAFDKAVERGARVGDARLESLAQGAGGGAGLGGDVCFGEL